MLLISQRESVELQEMGYEFASKRKDGMLHKSHSRHPKYYLTEEKKAVSKLYELRNAKISR